VLGWGTGERSRRDEQREEGLRTAAQCAPVAGVGEAVLRPVTVQGPSEGGRAHSLSTQVLRELHECLGATAEALAEGPVTGRVRTAVEKLVDAREALVPLLRERGAAGPGPEPARGVERVVRTVDLPPEDEPSRLGRAFCREVLDEWALPRSVVEAAVDVASELVTNAAGHARSSLCLALEVIGDELVVSVWDDGPGRPHLLPHRPGPSDRGIGLHWVEALTTAWGWTDERGGKRVWAVVPVRA
jgi:anti-sigma regulatory factor (Ser/Thr protein kinase)